MGQTEWELRQDKDDILIYTRELPGKSYLEFKASTTVKGSMHSMMSLLKSVDDMNSWMKNFEVNELLASNDFWHQVSYHEVYVPILYNRDVILELNIKQDTIENALRIDLKGLPEYIPEKRKKSRIQEIHGYWILKPISSGEIYVEYSMYLDPGSIPSWVYNMRIKKDPYTTLMNIRSKVKEEGPSQAYYPEITLENETTKDED